ncbi:MAG: hypothetical protein HRU22_02075 [Gammaproteobacteria bacterium]|nr:hypothetical protein [Gammaproteobacteria bacterium]
MSTTLLATAALISQLCYDPQQDIGDHFWLKRAQIFEKQLTVAVNNKTAICLPLRTEQQRKEAQYLANVDATKQTIIVK